MWAKRREDLGSLEIGSGNTPLPTLIPPKKTGTMLFIVNDELVFGGRVGRTRFIEE
jgi:hypothetical protein